MAVKLLSRLSAHRTVLLAVCMVLVVVGYMVSSFQAAEKTNKLLVRSQSHAQGLMDFIQQLAYEVTETYRTSLETPVQLCSNSTSTLAIVVPYRNREAHLKVFLPWMRRHLLAEHARRLEQWSQGLQDQANPPVCQFAKFVIVEQADNTPFNRAWLLNIGSAYAYSEYGADVLSLHDVDTLPLDGVHYLNVPPLPLQLSGEIDRYGFVPHYPANAGGVNLLQYSQFAAFNGFSNGFDGWGAEDDDFFHRLESVGLIERAGIMNRPPVGHGRFFTLSSKDHTERDKSGYSERMQQTYGRSYDAESNAADGLSTLRYHLKDAIALADDTVVLKVVRKPSH
ncbi:hypothetical protein CAOG_007329 [Capsaspora owczarzaki ATCC 30864]|uniref:Uncharacterized protein n=2 Tax=Capsaspora owczarzaki (strain ATCC 30864) TaxID=595528 RepID=A0A0D2WWS4_CAPO3|nr:hypothetical protein CAOG_007329 [Capsaspora owczarzaki ATCC 30864]